MTTFQKNLHTLRGQADDRALVVAKRRFAQATSPPAPGRENRQGTLTRRWATVTAINPDRTVNLSIDNTTLSNIKTVNSYAPTVNDTVMLDFLGADPIVMGTLGTPQAGTLVQIQSWAPQAMTGAGATGGTSTFFSYNSPSTFSFTKRYAGTKIKFIGTVSGYAGSAVGLINIGVNWPGVNLVIGGYSFNALNDHRTIGCETTYSGLAAGTTVFQAIYATTVGQSFNADTNDAWRIQVQEVW